MKKIGSFTNIKNYHYCKSKWKILNISSSPSKTPKNSNRWVSRSCRSRSGCNWFLILLIFRLTVFWVIWLLLHSWDRSWNKKTNIILFYVYLISTVTTSPIPFRDETAQGRIAVNVAAIKITYVTNKKDILIISSAAHITNKVVLLSEDHFFWFNFDHFRFFIFKYFFYFVETFPATRTDSRSFCPFPKTLEAEFVFAWD